MLQMWTAFAMGKKFEVEADEINVVGEVVFWYAAGKTVLSIAVSEFEHAFTDKVKVSTDLQEEKA